MYKKTRNLIITFVLFLFLIPMAVMSQTWYVSSAGNDGTGDGSMGNPWLTITATLGKPAVLSGHTIFVIGVLTENTIVVTKDVTIRGGTVQAYPTRNATVAGFNIFDVPIGRTVSFIDMDLRYGDFAVSGGALANAGTVTMTNCNIYENDAGVSGGGIYNWNKLTMNNCAVYDNASLNSGGGIHILSDWTSTFTNCTIADNIAVSEGGTMGGGIYLENGLLNLNCCTISNNTADFGGGIYMDRFWFEGSWLYGTLNIRNTIIAGNIATNTGFDFLDPYGRITSFGYNLISDDSPDDFTTNTTGDHVGDPDSDTPQNAGATVVPGVVINPFLSALSNNGGTTPTMALQVGSPAIDQIPTPFNGSPTIDQRYYLRDADYDKGAYEYGAVADVPLPPWAMYSFIALLITMGGWFVYRRLM